MGRILHIPSWKDIPGGAGRPERYAWIQLSGRAGQVLFTPCDGERRNRESENPRVTDEEDPWEKLPRGASPESEVLTGCEWHQFFQRVWRQNPFIYITDTPGLLSLKFRLSVVCSVDSGCN